MKNIMTGNLIIKLILGTLIFIFLTYIFSGCGILQRRYEKTETKEYKITTTGKNKVIVNNKNGNINVTKNTKDSLIYINAEITSYLTKKELDESKKINDLNIDTISSEIRISGIQNVQEKRFFNFFKKSENINYTIYLPSGIDFEVENVNGKFEASNVLNSLSGDIVNGSVKLENTNGKLKFDVTNGKIKAELDSTEGINFDIVNGNVEMNLSPSFSGKFKADWVNGSINYENFSFQNIVKEKKSFTGQLGISGKEVIISIVNGNIKLFNK